jgi:mannosyltransferase OCH1-like enzyme
MSDIFFNELSTMVFDKNNNQYVMSLPNSNAQFSMPLPNKKQTVTRLPNSKNQFAISLPNNNQYDEPLPNNKNQFAMLLSNKKKTVTRLPNKKNPVTRLPNNEIVISPFPNKISYNSIIPLNIFQTWHTKEMPTKMLDTVELLKRQNPEFKHYLYDDDECREFIKENFPEEVLNAYNSLIPLAYKADLWRYCILYKEGGIYLDVKYLPYNEFKFINLTEKEHFVLDLPSCNTGVSGIYNALMVCLPGNKILLEAINQIVENVANNYYGKCWLEPTGPLLLSKYFSDTYKKSLELKHNHLSLNDQDDKVITYNAYNILKVYKGYFNERNQNSEIEHYADLWKEKRIYFINSLSKKFLQKDYIPDIPLTIYQTWCTKNLPPKMLDTVELLKRQNPEFKHYLYDDDECINFIKENFPEEVLNAYNSLIPVAYKADLWRLCILYINGGIYMDIKFSCVNGFKLIELTENDHFVLDRQNHFSINTHKPIYNAMMVSKKNNPFLLLGIKKIVENVKNKYYGENPLYPTGPGMLSEVLLNNNLNINIDLFHEKTGKYLIYKNRFVISVVYPEYRDEQKTVYKKINTIHYHDSWHKKYIYM